MKKKAVLMLSIVLLSGVAILIRRPARAQAATADKVPAGVVLAHFAGRLVGNNNEFELLGYYTFGEVTSFNDVLFAGPPSERTARGSFRSDRFRLNLISNGEAFQVSRAPSTDGSVPAVRIYFDPSPNRDFDQPESFSTGVLAGVLRPRNTQGILVPAQMFHLTGTADVESLPNFVGNGLIFDGGGIPGALTISIDGVPPSRTEILEGSKFSVPFTMTAIATAAEQKAP